MEPDALSRNRVAGNCRAVYFYTMSDYERIAAVIRYLDSGHISQPSIAKLSEIAGVSVSHFHRLFKRWAGISPKDFLQCLTLEHAKRCLNASRSVLDTALDAGLSGPGRLHDLLVSIDAASPGEIRAGGEGICVEWGVADSPFGICSLGWNNRGICHLAFHDKIPDFPGSLHENWPRAGFSRTDAVARKKTEEIFVRTTGHSIHAFVPGTAFQLKVWRALLRIPRGSVTTYASIASAVGHPGAVRAVGTACGANPVAWLIPCHRVIRGTGAVNGYRWGVERKQAMLAVETAMSEK